MWERQQRADPKRDEIFSTFKTQNSERTIQTNAPSFSTKELPFGKFPYSPDFSLNIKL